MYPVKNRQGLLLQKSNLKCVQCTLFTIFITISYISLVKIVWVFCFVFEFFTMKKIYFFNYTRYHFIHLDFATHEAAFLHCWKHGSFSL